MSDAADDFIKAADEIIAEFGQSVVISRDGTAIATAMGYYYHPGARQRAYFEDAYNVDESELGVLYLSGTVPGDVGDRVEISGDSHIVISIPPRRVSGTPVIKELWLRRES